MEDLPIQFRFVEGIAVVTVEGPLDYEVTTLVGEAMLKLVERERYRIILDLQRPGVVSSSILGVFMSYFEELQDKATSMETIRQIKLVLDDPRVYNIFGLLGFGMLFGLYESVSEALDAFLDGGNDLTATP